VSQCPLLHAKWRNITPFMLRQPGEGPSGRVGSMRGLTQATIYAIIPYIVILSVLDTYMERVIHTKISEGRRVAIPAELCERYGIAPGDRVVLEPSESGIVMRPLDAVIREVQAYFADVAPPSVSLSEELLRDRRAEAERENRG
jgi:AbrB family looped-hinge helix DNA binding protein